MRAKLFLKMLLDFMELAQALEDLLEELVKLVTRGTTTALHLRAAAATAVAVPEAETLGQYNR